MRVLTQRRTTHDARADARFAYAQGAFEDGDWLTAIDLARQCLELAPSFAPALALLGRALIAAGKLREAVPALQGALEREPDDTLGVALDLARLGHLNLDQAMREGYVRALFDAYAPDFDRHLQEKLNYRGPQVLMAALPERNYGLVLDLGCGTGLMGEAIRSRVQRLEGCDLSPAMIERAQAKGIYDALEVSEACAFLGDHRKADAVLAADVVVYFADLGNLFKSAHEALCFQGIFAFSAQHHEGEGVVLGSDSRYAHGHTYLENLAKAYGFAILHDEAVSTRHDGGVPVPGRVMVLEKQ